MGSDLFYAWQHCINMTVEILINPDRKIRPEGAVRCDVAWKLFDPDHMGEFRKESLKAMTRFTQWLWSELSMRSGFLRPDRPDRIFLITPDMTDAAISFLIRIASYWDSTVHVRHNVTSMEQIQENENNSWIPPVYNIGDGRKPDSAQEALKEKDDAGTTSFLAPLSGYSHAFMRTYTINPGHTYSRNHSHTAREEHYLVIAGSGIARIADREVPIREGDIVFKPTGPDLSTQFLSVEEPLKILDIEIWNDPARNDKDVVAYPDHGELCLFGPGWFTTFPLNSMMSARDSMSNYETGYIRRTDGTWESAEVPGFKPRKD